MFASLVLLLGLLGCGGECATATCVGDQAVRDWPGDREGVTARIAAIPDDMVRTTVVGRVSDAFPGQTRQLCKALPKGVSRERCDRLNNRPHLSYDPNEPPERPPLEGAAGQQRKMATTPAGILGEREHGLPDVRIAIIPNTPDAPLCVGSADAAACLDEEAGRAALLGEAGLADAICGRQSDARWADECRFQAAEQAVKRRSGKAYATAAALCGAATMFEQECYVHILTWVPRQVWAPNAGAMPATEATGVAKQIQIAWIPAGEGVGDRHVERFWAIYLARSYQLTDDPDGTPLSRFPSVAWPHVRAAAATRMRELGVLKGSLAEQVAALEAALARRADGKRMVGRPPALIAVQNFGRPAEDGPTTPFLNSVLRPLGQDPAADTLYCVVISAAHADPPDLALLREATSAADPRIAAEARRLLALVAPS